VKEETKGDCFLPAQGHVSSPRRTPPATGPAPGGGRPLLSVIIPLHNGCALTRRCLSSLLTALKDVHAEIILVDNGSDDETPDWLAALPEGIRVIRNSENLGFATACNQGAMASCGRYLLFLNNDTEVSPAWLAPLLQAVEQPAVGVVGCKLLYPDGTIQHAGIELIRGVPDHPFRFAPSDMPEANRPREMDMVTGACLLIPRTLFFPLLGFDETFLNGVEDVDLCLRARMAGFRVFYEPRASAFHREGQTPGRFQHARRNLQLFFTRWGQRFDGRGAFRTDPSPRLIPASRSRLRESRLSIVWEGSQFALHSLAKVNRELCRRLLEEGHALTLLTPDHERSFPGDSPVWQWLAAQRKDVSQAPEGVWVRHQWPPLFRPPGSMPWVMIQPWEYGSLPREWIAPLSTRVDEVWVPTHYVRDCFLRSGVAPDRVVVVPNGVDVGCYRPGRRPYPLKTRKSFRFLFVGGTIWRKGIDILLDAYANAFTARDDVCLVIKDMGGDTFYRGQTARQRIQEFVSVPGHPEIECVEDPIAREEDMAGLYAACHCLVHPYRGEGFGLPIAEAMACGLPVIVTGHGAALDFCNEEIAYLIPAREIRLPEKRVGTLETVDYPWVAEVDRDALCTLLRHVVQDREEASRKGKRAADFVAERFSWENAVHIALSRLQALAEKPVAKPRAAGRSSGQKAPTRYEEPELAVVVISSGGAQALRGCLRSLYATAGTSFSLQVLFPGGDLAGERQPKRLAKRFPGCQAHCCAPDRLAEALSRVIDSGSSRYVCLLSDEIRLLPNWFEGLREHLEAVPDGGIWAPMIFGGGGVQGSGPVSAAAAHHAKRVEAYRQRYRYRRIPVDVPEPSCLLFRRGLIAQVPIPSPPHPARADGLLRRWCAAVAAAGYANTVAGDVFVVAANPSPMGRRGSRNVSVRSQVLQSFRNGDLTGALSRLVRSIQDDPRRVANHLFLAELLLRANRPHEALEILEALPPSHEEAVRAALCGLAYRLLGRRDLAEQKSAEALCSPGGHPMAWRLAGLLAEDAGVMDSAQHAFTEAIRVDPSWGLPRADQSRVLLAIGKRQEALEELEKAFILSPTEPEISTAYFERMFAADPPPQAEELFREAVRLHPEDRRLRFLWIAALLKRERHDEAMNEIEEAMAVFPVDDGMLQSALAVRRRVGPMGPKPAGSSPPRVSACLIVKNEESRLPRALLSLRGLVDEIIIVDTGSTDRTRPIAEALGARVFATAWNDDFAAARNVGLAQASGEWILILDADEEIAPQDHETLRRLVTSRRNKKAAFRLTTRNYTEECGARGWVANDGSYPDLERGSGWFPSAKVRLFPRDPRIRFVYPVHEVVEPTLRELGIPILEGDVPIHHYGRLDKARLIEKGKTYLSLGLKKLDQLGDDPTALRELAGQAAGIQDYELALRLWERLLAGHPEDAAAWMNAGFAALRCERLPQAIACSKRALALDPAMREAALNLAAGHWASGDLEGAEEVLVRLLANEADYPPALCRMAALRFAQGKAEEALSLARRLRALGFDLQGAFRELAAELRHGGREDLARLLLERWEDAGERGAGIRHPFPTQDPSAAEKGPLLPSRRTEAQAKAAPAALP